MKVNAYIELPTRERNAVEVKNVGGVERGNRIARITSKVEGAYASQRSQAALWEQSAKGKVKDAAKVERSKARKRRRLAARK